MFIRMHVAIVLSGTFNIININYANRCIFVGSDLVGPGFRLFVEHVMDRSFNDGRALCTYSEMFR